MAPACADWVVAEVTMISMWKVREMVDKATNLVMNYTETEAKVRYSAEK